jgi:hypothetical protein
MARVTAGRLCATQRMSLRPASGWRIRIPDRNLAEAKKADPQVCFFPGEAQMRPSQTGSLFHESFFPF